MRISPASSPDTSMVVISPSSNNVVDAKSRSAISRRRPEENERKERGNAEEGLAAQTKRKKCTLRDSPLQGVWAKLKQPRLREKEKERSELVRCRRDKKTTRSPSSNEKDDDAMSTLVVEVLRSKEPISITTQPATSKTGGQEIAATNKTSRMRSPVLEERRPKGLRLDLNLVDEYVSSSSSSGTNSFDHDLLSSSSGTFTSSTGSAGLSSYTSPDTSCRRGIYVDTAKDCSRELSSVTPSIFVSGSAPARDYTRLLAAGVTHIINCCEHRVSSDISRFHILDLRLNDSSSSDIAMYIYTAIDFIESAIASKGKVLVHCLKGISRSASLVIAYLMWKRDMGVRQALAFVQRARPSVNPNGDFLVQLRHWYHNRPSMSPTCNFLYRVCAHQTRQGDTVPALSGPISGRILLEVIASSRHPSATVESELRLNPEENDTSTTLANLKCFLLYTSKEIYVWTDTTRSCESVRALIRKALHYLRTFENCKGRDVVWTGSGRETESFWFALRKASMVDGVLTPRLKRMELSESTPWSVVERSGTIEGSRVVVPSTTKTPPPKIPSSSTQ